MHRNEIFYALISINNLVLSCLISMLSMTHMSPCQPLTNEETITLFALVQLEMKHKDPGKERTLKNIKTIRSCSMHTDSRDSNACQQCVCRGPCFPIDESSIS